MVFGISGLGSLVFWAGFRVLQVQLQALRPKEVDYTMHIYIYIYMVTPPPMTDRRGEGEGWCPYIYIYI